MGIAGEIVIHADKIQSLKLHNKAQLSNFGVVLLIQATELKQKLLILVQISYTLLYFAYLIVDIVDKKFYSKAEIIF